MDRRTKITYLLSLVQEQADLIQNEEVDDLSAEDILNLAVDMVVADEYNKKSKQYQPLVAVVNKDEAFSLMNDGTFQPLFEVPDDD